MSMFPPFWSPLPPGYTPPTTPTGSLAEPGTSWTVAVPGTPGTPPSIAGSPYAPSSQVPGVPGEDEYYIVYTVLPHEKPARSSRFRGWGSGAVFQWLAGTVRGVVAGRLLSAGVAGMGQPQRSLTELGVGWISYQIAQSEDLNPMVAQFLESFGVSAMVSGAMDALYSLRDLWEATVGAIADVGHAVAALPTDPGGVWTTFSSVPDPLEPSWLWDLSNLLTRPLPYVGPATSPF